MRVLGVIPARGGSKGIPRKNIKLLAGKPLLQYTAEAAFKAQRLSRLIVSTDDEEIAEVARSCGVEVPFRRPPELAADETPMILVVRHALQWADSSGSFFDAVCLLQPTSPLRRSEDIDACIDLLQETGVDAVVTTLSVPPIYNPHWVYFCGPSGLLHLSTGEDVPVARRQDLPPAFHREGSVYVTRRNAVLEHGSLYGKQLLGYVLASENSLNLDSPEDWRRAEERLTAMAG